MQAGKVRIDRQGGPRFYWHRLHGSGPRIGPGSGDQGTPRRLMHLIHQFHDDLPGGFFAAKGALDNQSGIFGESAANVALFQMCPYVYLLSQGFFCILVKPTLVAR